MTINLFFQRIQNLEPRIREDCCTWSRHKMFAIGLPLGARRIIYSG